MSLTVTFELLAVGLLSLGQFAVADTCNINGRPCRDCCSGGLSTDAIIGIVAAALAVVVIIMGVVAYCLFNKDVKGVQSRVTAAAVTRQPEPPMNPDHRSWLPSDPDWMAPPPYPSAPPAYPDPSESPPPYTLTAPYYPPFAYATVQQQPRLHQAVQLYPPQESSAEPVQQLHSTQVSPVSLQSAA